MLSLAPEQLVWTTGADRPANTPLNPWRNGAPQPLDSVALQARFREGIGERGGVLQDLFVAATRQFVDAVVLADPAGFAALRSRPAVYLANHQVAIESMLFIALIDVLTGLPCRAIAKREHRATWMGALDRLIFEEIGRQSLLLFDRAQQADLLAILHDFAGPDRRPPCSLLAHVQGTRALRAGEPVTQVSSAFLDLALRCDLPVIPVRFAGGLPREPLTSRLELPHGFARQRYFIGAAIDPAALRNLKLRDRKQLVCEAINGLGPSLETEAPATADPAFGAAVAALQQATRLGPMPTLLLACLEALPHRCAESTALLDFLRTGRGDPAHRAAFAGLLSAFGAPAR